MKAVPGGCGLSKVMLCQCITVWVTNKHTAIEPTTRVWRFGSAVKEMQEM